MDSITPIRLLVSAALFVLWVAIVAWMWWPRPAPPDEMQDPPCDDCLREDLSVPAPYAVGSRRLCPRHYDAALSAIERDGGTR